MYGSQLLEHCYQGVCGPMQVCYMPESLCKLDVLTHEHHLCTFGRGVMLLSIM